MPQFAFSLVSPEREVFSGEVDSVSVPGTEGVFEVMAGHAPVMATLSPGLIEVRHGNETHRTFVRGGFADVSANGLTVLAEKAVAETELQGEVLTGEREIAKGVIDDKGAAADDKLQAQRALDALAKF